MRAFQECWNQEKHISLFILWWRSKHHLSAEWADILKEYGMSRKLVLALELSTCDIRSPIGIEEKSWPLSRATTAVWVTVHALKGVCWLPTVRFFLSYENMQNLFCIVLYLIVFSNYSTIKLTFMYMLVLIRVSKWKKNRLILFKTHKNIF